MLKTCFAKSKPNDVQYNANMEVGNGRRMMRRFLEDSLQARKNNNSTTLAMSLCLYLYEMSTYYKTDIISWANKRIVNQTSRTYEFKLRPLRCVGVFISRSVPGIKVRDE